MADQAKFLSFLDMIDGGGAGKMGDKFEGGGIFSALANMIAKPYGSVDEERKAARMAAYGMEAPAAAPSSIVRPIKRGGGGGATPAPTTTPAAQPLTYGPQGGRGGPRGMSREDRLMQQPVQANPMYTQAIKEKQMGLSPFGGANVPTADPYAYMFNRGQQGMPAAAAGNAEYTAFMDRVKNDPLFAGVIDNPVAMENIFKMYQANMGR